MIFKKEILKSSRKKKIKTNNQQSYKIQNQHRAANCISLTDNEIVGGTTDRKRSPWLGLIVITYMSYLTRGVSGKEELTLYHQAEEFRKGQKERGEVSVYVLPQN